MMTKASNYLKKYCFFHKTYLQYILSNILHARPVVLRFSLESKPVLQSERRLRAAVICIGLVAYMFF